MALEVRLEEALDCSGIAGLVMGVNGTHRKRLTIS